MAKKQKDKKPAHNSLSLDELRTKAVELEANIFKLRMQKTTGQLADTSLIRQVRKEFARVKTFQTQKQGK